MALDNNNHSVFLLNYHLVLCTKYRKKVINEEISERLKNILVDTSSKYGITLVEWNHDKDHVHLLFREKPDSDLSKMISADKSASSRRIKNEFPNIRKYLWKEYFWSRSYCLLTTGGVTIDVIKKNIENQGK